MAPADRKISSVALSRTGRWLAAGTSDGAISVWDRATGTVAQHIQFDHGPLNDLQFSPDETLLAVAARDLVVYQLGQSALPRLLRSDGRNYGTVRFSADGTTILVVTGKATVEEIDVHSGASRIQICCSSIYGEVAFTPDRQTIVNAGHWPSLWDAGSGHLVAHLANDREFYAFRPIAFDDDGGTILMGSQNGRVYVWSLATKQLAAISPAQSQYVDVLTVLAGGWVAYAGLGKPLRLWNPQTGQHRSLPGAIPTSNLIRGPNGSVIFGTADRRIQYRDTRIRTAH